MKTIVEVNILQEIICHDEKEQRSLIDNVFQGLTIESKNKVIKDSLKDFLEAEQEFHKRKNVIDALEVLINIEEYY